MPIHGKIHIQEQYVLTATVASLTGFEFDQLQCVDVRLDNGMPVEEAQPAAARSHPVRVDDARLERTACNHVAKVIFIRISKVQVLFLLFKVIRSGQRNGNVFPHIGVEEDAFI